MFDNEDILGRLGLQPKTTPRDYLLPVLGIFSAGIVVGAATALLVTPRSGSEIRREMGRRATRLRYRLDPRLHTDDLDTLTRDELYERAKVLDIDGRSEMTKQELLDAVKES